MVILIDGYNFLKTVEGTNFIDDRIMYEWIKKFKQYIAYRHNKIILVFDGGSSVHASCQWDDSVEIWYAGQYQSADDVIKSFLDKKKHVDILVVTSDRAICSYAKMLGIVTMGSLDFYKVFINVWDQSWQVNFSGNNDLVKTKENEESDNILDQMMDFASRDMASENHKNEYDIKIRVPNSKKKSKQDRFQIKKIDKI